MIVIMMITINDVAEFEAVSTLVDNDYNDYLNEDDGWRRWDGDGSLVDEAEVCSLFALYADTPACYKVTVFLKDGRRADRVTNKDVFNHVRMMMRSC